MRLHIPWAVFAKTFETIPAVNKLIYHSTVSWAELPCYFLEAFIIKQYIQSKFT